MSCRNVLLKPPLLSADLLLRCDRSGKYGVNDQEYPEEFWYAQWAVSCESCRYIKQHVRSMLHIRNMYQVS